MNITGIMIEPKPKEPLPGNAADRKRRKILSQTLNASSMVFINKQHFRKGMKGLDLNCGEGDLTFQFVEKVGAKGKMTGLDSNPVFIKIAQEKAIQSAHQNVHFHCQHFSAWSSEEQFDFIFSQILLSQSTYTGALLTKAFEMLKSGGMILMEELDLSGFQCFPYCFAFDRFVELYNELSIKKGFDPNIGSKLMFLLQKSGFNNIRVQQTAPSFFGKNEKKIASVTLESIAPELLEEQLISPSELQALLYELKTFENKENTLISLPGVYQVTGFKI